jgi:hypothetical protein
MDEQGKSEKIIDKLIKKRKQENVAFIKLLQAIESKGSSTHEDAKPKEKNKP